MMIVTKAIEKQLRANSANTDKDNIKPVMKLFGGSACTWLISEMDQDGDTLFGLCDLGMGSPELGYVSLKELLALRFRPFGLPIERDRYFAANKTLVEYANEARSADRIVA